jgi:hypothetical protein
LNAPQDELAGEVVVNSTISRVGKDQVRVILRSFYMVNIFRVMGLGENMERGTGPLRSLGWDFGPGQGDQI